MPRDRRALVTGASAGISAAFARHLAADGFDLVLVARGRERLDAFASELREQAGVNVDVIAADLADRDDRRRVEEVLASDAGVEVLINNAGFGRYGRFAELGADTVAAMVEVHVVATTCLTRAALPGMLRRRRGAVINVSSLFAFTGSIPPEPMPFRVTYAASKAFIMTLTESLSHELAGTGVQVQALCPGIVRTDFHRLAGVDPSVKPRFDPMEAAEVVEASLSGLELGEVLCLPGLQEPGLIDRLAEAQRSVFLGAAPGPRAPRYERTVR